jgi:myosin heavy subunit
VVSHLTEEQSFHVFYYLLHGAPAAMLASLALDRTKVISCMQERKRKKEEEEKKEKKGGMNSRRKR